jgi:hypothetical protein
MDTINLKANEILNVSISSANLFFSGKTEEAIKKQYKKLASIWHPDKHTKDNINSEEVFKHIKVLYNEAIKRLTLGIFDNIIKFNSLEGKSFELKFLKEDIFELGTVYISQTHIAYCYKKEFKDFYENYLLNIKHFSFANEKMEKEIKKTLPQFITNFETEEAFVIIIKKDKSLIQLKEVLNYYNGKIEPRHVAWIINSIYNIACYLNYNNLCHQGINIDNYYVDPVNHYGALLGGWSYSMMMNKKLIGLPKATIEICSPTILKEKKATTTLDLDLIRQMARQLLGDSSGVFFNNKEVPSKLIQWTQYASGNNAIEEYKKFNLVLNEVFGKRKYLKMELNADSIYKK